MKEISISIVIPVYNVEPYIERCFQSVISQTYRNYEIIFVDDCGTDKSIEILSRLMKEYKGELVIKLFHHEKNLGAATARNNGMKIASGEYFLFVDSDDFISSDCLESLVVPLQQKKYNLVVGRSVLNYNGQTLLSKIPEEISEDTNPLCRYFRMMSCRMGGSASNRLYDSAYVRQNNILFNPESCVEDFLFNIEFYCKNPLVFYNEKPTYTYDIRENTVSTTKNEKLFNDEITCVEILESLFLKNNLLSNSDVIAFLVQRRFRLLIISPDFNNHSFEKIFHIVRARGFRKNEWTVLSLRHKLLYIQQLLPEKIAYLYTKCFVWLYRTFIWKR